MREISGTGMLMMPRVEGLVFGSGCAAQLPMAVAMTGMQKPFLLSTPSLQANGTVEKIEALLGDALAGTFAGSAAHNPTHVTMAAVEAARSAGADGLITLGGSSVVDLGKAVAMVLAEGEDLDALRIRYSLETGPVIPPLMQPKVPQIAVPTTLSGSEYTFATAITDTQHGEKLMFADPKLTPKAVFHDAELCMPTPDRLWVGTGMKIFADCLEMLMSRQAKPITDMYAREGLRVLYADLPRSIGASASVQARQNLLYAAYLGMAMMSNASLGMVGGIRHQLGGNQGVPHGEGSTIVLPHVLRWNREEAAAEAALAEAARTLGLAGDTQAALADALIAAVDGLIADLGLPQTLREAGIEESALPGVAAHVVGDISIAHNGRQVGSADDVMQVLNAAY